MEQNRDFATPPPGGPNNFFVFQDISIKFFWIIKSNFVVQKKKFFDGKPKMTKISGFENFEIAKNDQISPFWRKHLCGQKRL